MDAHGRSWTVMDGHGRSWTVMDAHGRSWTLGGRDGHVGWTRRSRWVDATVSLGGRYGHVGGRDGNATVTVTLPNYKNHCNLNSNLLSNKIIRVKWCSKGQDVHRTKMISSQYIKRSISNHKSIRRELSLNL